MSEQKLGRDVFRALAAIAWADGKLHEEEADAIVRMAVEEGLEMEEIAEIEETVKTPVDLGVIDRTTMSKADRLFVYAVAAWMTRLDGARGPDEEAMLDALGDVLRIPPRPREHAEAIAREIAEATEGELVVSRYDLPLLRKTIAERLEQARKARLAEGEPE
jgi:uncharacterized membrane protein YebE (DUF533 family)